MMLMNYIFGLTLVFVVFGVIALGFTLVPYYGVIALMGVSFFCCVFMVVLGRTFAALVMYIVYLGGLIVVFGYCVSVEKDSSDFLDVSLFKYFVVLLLSSVAILLVLVDELGGLLNYIGWEDLLCLELNGGVVFYSSGGVGLIVCSWGLLVVLFAVLIILGWSRFGGLRPF